MHKVIAVAVILAYLVKTLRYSAYLVFLWQKREYRLDRMRSHLKTPLGKKLVFGVLPIFKWTLFLLFLTVRQSTVLITIFWLFWLLWLFEAVLYIKEFFKGGWRWPEFTVKSLLILLVALSIQFIPILTVGWLTPLFWAPFLDRLTGPLITVLVFIFNLPSNFVKELIILRARHKISKLSLLKTIAITGSLGKTSTKEFLRQILSKKFKIVSTGGSTNTEIGIAQIINNDLTSETDIFIAESGAYREGEIAKIGKLIKPQIAVITTISNQHLDLFGTIDKTARAKFELIESLPENGLAVFNSANKYTLKMAENAGKLGLSVIKVKPEDEFRKIKATRDNLEFSLKKSGLGIKINILGEHNLMNLALAISVARKLGLSDADIAAGLKKIKPVEKTLKKVFKSNKLTVIDDTFNVSEEGLLAACQYAQKYKGHKYLVLTPLIELGNEASSVHRMLGREMGDTFDKILITNRNYLADLKSGSEKPENINLVILQDLDMIKKETPADSVIIFEGKEAEKWLKLLLKSFI